MKTAFYSFYLIWFSTVFLSCKGTSQRYINTVQEAEGVTIILSDSSSAAALIQQDDADGFFDYIMPLDIQIQMKNGTGCHTKEHCLTVYREFLSRQVSQWTVTDTDSLMPVIENAVKISNAIAGKFMPDSIYLVKIKTGHYGNDVYYTRGKCIMIPENIFQNFDSEMQLPVMIHEIFHIISRYQPEIRDSLYSMIGFERLDGKVTLPPQTEKIVLTNPDGAMRTHAIRLTAGQSNEVLAIPLITSKFRQYRTEIPLFFDYLNFDLYEIVPTDGGNYTVKAGPGGGTTLDLGYTPMFFTKIRDNTQYIIHPEEIMADNFMLAVLAVHKSDFSRFSPKGRQLIDSLIRYFQKINR